MNDFSLKYDDILRGLLKENPANKVFPEVIRKKVILIISLSTGLPLNELLTLKWEDIITIDSKSNPKLLDELRIRNYPIYLSKRVEPQISAIFIALKYPELDSYIIDKKNRHLDKLIIAFQIHFDNGWKHLNTSKLNPRLSQVIFGHKILKTCGYSNAIGHYLKVHFRVKTNKELCDFLKINDLKSIHPSIPELSIVENESSPSYKILPSISFLDDDKNFYIKDPKTGQYYPFEHFNAFFNFLDATMMYKHDISTQSILLLLLMGLLSGKRLSNLLSLSLGDVLEHREKKIYNYRDSIELDGFTFIMFEQVNKKLHSYIRNRFAKEGISMDYKDGWKVSKKLELSKPLFISNRLSPITQPSLHREIRKALEKTEYRHYNKFTTSSTRIMFGRRVLELMGCDKPTVKLLKQHYNFRTSGDLYEFLHIKGDFSKTFKNVYEHILYDY